MIVIGSLTTVHLANAAPQTDPIPLATIGTAPPARTGTLPNGVTWSVDIGTWHAGGQGYIIFGGQTQTWTFDRTVSLEFSVRGLTGPGECMQVPPGSVLVSLAPSHSYNPTTHLVCYVTNVPTADSFFTLGPTTSLVLIAAGHPELGRGPGSIRVTFDEEPALSIVKSSSTVTIPPLGETIPYSFLVTNTGNVAMAGIAVTDPNTAGVTCPVTTLAPTSSTTCTGTHTVTQAEIDAGAVVNTATVVGTPPSGTPIPPVASNEVTITVAQIESLSIVKSSPTTTLPPLGATIPYEFLVTNTGNVTMAGIAVTDPNTAGVTCPVTTLAPTSSTTCTGTHTVTQADVDAGIVTNIAAVVGAAPGGTPIPAEQSNRVTITGRSNPALSILKTSTTTTLPPLGATIPYEFLVTNTGNVTITGIVVTDPNTAGVTCPVTTLAPTSSTTCMGAHTVTQAEIDAGAVVNTATVVGTPPSGAPIPPLPSNEVTIVGTRNPALAIVKSSTTAAVAAAGQTVPYTFTVTNTGNVTISAIAVSDPSIAGVTCPQTTLEPGASTTCTAVYTVTAIDLDNGQIVNVATVTGTPPSGSTLGEATSNTVTIPAAQSPSLSIVKSASTESGAVDQVIAFTLAVTNTGNVTVSNIVVRDAMVGAAVTCPDTTLAAGASMTCSANYTITEADASTGQVINTATVVGTPPGRAPMRPAVSNQVLVAIPPRSPSAPTTPATPATPTTSPVAGQLPGTGTSIARIAGIGLALALLGTALTSASRRRKRITR